MYMEPNFSIFRRWLCTITTCFLILVPCVSKADYYTRLLLEWLAKTPHYITGKGDHAVAYAPDIMIRQSQLSAVKIPIALNIPHSACTSPQTDSDEASALVCSVPAVEVSFIQEFSDWQPVTVNDDMTHMDEGRRHQFTINLLNVNPVDGTRFLVIRVHVRGSVTTEFKFIVAVVPDEQKPDIAVYDFDGTVALKIHGANNLIPLEFARNSIKENLKNGQLIAYNTSRSVELTEKLREWLIRNDFPPGLIFAAPESLNRSSEEARKDYKLKVLRELNAHCSVTAMWGDSAVADALAGMEAQIPKVHLLHYHLMLHSHPEKIIDRIPANYHKSAPKPQFQRFGSREIRPLHHTYEKTLVVRVEQQDPAPIQCVGIGCLPPPPGNRSFAEIHPAHPHMVIRAMQNQHPGQSAVQVVRE